MAQAKAKAAAANRAKAEADLAIATSVQLKADYDNARARLIEANQALLEGYDGLKHLVDAANAAGTAANEALEAAQRFAPPSDVLGTIPAGSLPTKALQSLPRHGRVPGFNWSVPGFANNRRNVDLSQTLLAD